MNTVRLRPARPYPAVFQAGWALHISSALGRLISVICLSPPFPAFVRYTTRYALTRSLAGDDASRHCRPSHLRRLCCRPDVHAFARSLPRRPMPCLLAGWGCCVCVRLLPRALAVAGCLEPPAQLFHSWRLLRLSALDRSIERAWARAAPGSPSSLAQRIWTR